MSKGRLEFEQVGEGVGDWVGDGVGDRLGRCWKEVGDGKGIEGRARDGVGEVLECRVRDGAWDGPSDDLLNSLPSA